MIIMRFILTRNTRYENQSLVLAIAYASNSNSEEGRILSVGSWRRSVASVGSSGGVATTGMYGEEETRKWDIEKQNEIGKDLQKKWKNVRNSFARELARRKNCKSGSGRTWKTYIYFEQLSFLMSSMSHAESESNFSHNEENEIEMEHEVNVPEVLSCVSPTKSKIVSRKRKRGVDSESDLATILAKSLKWKQENESLKNDPDRLFLLLLLQDFKMIPTSRKPSIKIAIINVISNGFYSPPSLIPPPHHNNNRHHLPTLSAHYSSHIPYDSYSMNCTVPTPHRFPIKSTKPHTTTASSSIAQSTPSPHSDFNSHSSTSDSNPFLTLY